MTHEGAGAASKELEGRLGHLKVGALRVWGDWFGKPYDNQHALVGVQASGNELLLTFGQGERLLVESPEDWTFDEDAFCIRRATSVVWRWYAYGRPQSPANLYTIEHRVTAGGQVSARSDEDWYQPKFAPSPNLAAVELL